MPTLIDHLIKPGEFSLDSISKSAESKGRDLAEQAMPDDEEFANRVARYIERRVPEEVALGGNASVKHYRGITETAYKTDITGSLTFANKYSQTDTFMNAVEHIVQEAIAPYKKEVKNVLAR